MLDETTPAEAVETAPPDIEQALEVEPTDALDAEVITDKPAEESTEEKADEVVDEPATDEKVETEVETAPEPVTFDATLETPVLVEQGKAVLDKYELPQDVQAYVTALEAKAVTPDLAEYSDYGGVEDVKSLLERQSYIDRLEPLEDGTYRPQTDKFVESITDPAKFAWLRHDVLNRPSDKYAGLTSGQEFIADYLKVDGESVEQTLARYEDTAMAMRTGARVVPDIPQFIDAKLQEAYSTLSKDERDEIALLDLNDEDDKDKAISKINNLVNIQKGINADKQAAQNQIYQQQARQQEQLRDVGTILTNFYDAFEIECAKTIAKEVQFSTDPKLNELLATQNVTMLKEAAGQSGERARAILEQTGIKFDYSQAQKLQKDIEKAGVSLAHANSMKDASGEALDKVALNQATKAFENAARNWQSFAKNLIDQQARLVSTGKAEEVKTAAAKIKVEAKARQVPKGANDAAAVKKDDLPKYGTLEWDKYWAKKTMDEQAARARVYTT